MVELKKTLKKKPEVEKLTLEELVDRVGALKEQIASLTFDLKKYDDLLKTELTSGLGEDDEKAVRGKEFMATIPIASTVRRISDMKKAKSYLGDAVFYQVAKINLTDLDKYLTPEQLNEVVVKERSSSRSMSLKRV